MRLSGAIRSQFGGSSLHLGIIRFKYSPFGGAEKIIERTVNELSKSRDVDGITIFSREWPDSLACRDKSFVKFVQVPASGFTRFSKLKSFDSNVQQLLSKYSHLNVIQAHDRVLGCDIFRAGDGVHRAWLDRLQSSMGFWRGLTLGHDPFHKWICSQEKLIAKDARITIVANSPLTFREVKDYLDVPSDRIRLIPNSIDVALWQSKMGGALKPRNARAKFGLRPDHPCVVFIGSGFSRKGVDPLIRAISLWPSAQLLVVGYDKDSDSYARLAEKIAPGRVFFAGPLTPVFDALSAGDVFALPSLYDSFSNATLEALAAGLPVVVTEDTGMAGYISKAGGGILATRQPGNLAAKLEEAYVKRHSLSQQALELVKNFDHSKIIPLWVSLYLEKLGTL